MNTESLRGSRLGGLSLETDRGVEYSERKTVHYHCSRCDNQTSLTFALEAEEPAQWDCAQCGESAALEGHVPNASESKPIKESKTHFEMLLERRTREELEEILNERLNFLRERRGAGLEDLAG